MTKELILVSIGVMLVVLGAVLLWGLISRRRRIRTIPADDAPGGVHVQHSSYSRFMRIPHSSLPASDLLRQLETAREQNQISEDEYQRLRRQILDRMS